MDYMYVPYPAVHPYRTFAVLFLGFLGFIIRCLVYYPYHEGKDQSIVERLTLSAEYVFDMSFHMSLIW